jgi:hypothetical protein
MKVFVQEAQDGNGVLVWLPHTRETLRRFPTVEEAEAWCRERGLEPVRPRPHSGIPSEPWPNGPPPDEPPGRIY